MHHSQHLILQVFFSISTQKNISYKKIYEEDNIVQNSILEYFCSETFDSNLEELPKRGKTISKLSFLQVYLVVFGK